MKKRNFKWKAMSLVCLSSALIVASAFSGCAGEGSKKEAEQTEAETENSENSAPGNASEKETKKVRESETAADAGKPGKIAADPAEKSTEKASEKNTSKATEANVPETIESVITATEQQGTETPAVDDPAAASVQISAAQSETADEAYEEPETVEDVYEEPETVKDVYDEPEDNTYRMELSDYTYEEGLQSLVGILELQEAEARQLGMYGVRYEGGGISVEWKPVSDTNPRTAITISSAGNDSVSMYGIYCGQSYADAKEWLLQSGWHIVGYNLEHPAEFYIEISGQEHDVIHLLTEEAGDTVSEWMWLNWPQGELVIN